MAPRPSLTSGIARQNPLSQGTAVSGATGLSLTDTGLTTGVPYYYVLSTTDGTTVATSLQIAVIPAKTVYVGVIGDSWLYLDLRLQLDLRFDHDLGGRQCPCRRDCRRCLPDGTRVVGNNQGIGGTNASQWLGSSSYLTSALAAFASHAQHDRRLGG